MPERYPDDATLLALEQDPTTGVEYIPTGRSPYFLEFRKLVQRTLLATERANDLRVHADGDLSVGVRPGRCLIHNTPIAFAGTTALTVPNNATTFLWLDGDGNVQTGGALPTDRTEFVPLAEVVTEAGTITQITDRRGEAFLAVPDLLQLGVTAARDDVNRALDGIAASVDAAALSRLTAGAESVANDDHQHTQVTADAPEEAELRLRNASADPAANIALHFDLPNRLPLLTSLLVDPDTGFLQQRYGTESYHLLGAAHLQHVHAGDLTGSLSDVPLGVAPVEGAIDAVVLSTGLNLETSDPADQLALAVKVHGTTITDAPATLTVANGAGFHSTDQGDGQAATIVTDGGEQVSRGDLLTIDLTRTVNGTVSVEARDVVALVVIRAHRPI